MRRVEDLSTTVGEIRGYLLDADSHLGGPAAEGAAAVLQEFLGVVAGLEEDLLVVLDDPTAAEAESWLRSFSASFESSGLGRKLRQPTAELGRGCCPWRGACRSLLMTPASAPRWPGPSA